MVPAGRGADSAQTTMTTIPIQRRTAILRPEPEGGCAIRVSHRAQRKHGQGYISPRYLLRCGCCDGALEIHYGPDGLEINGVYGSIENWREILLPLLRMNQRGEHFIPEVIDRKISKPSSKQKRAIPSKPKSSGNGQVDPDETLTPGEAKLVRRGEAQLKSGESKPWRDVRG